MKYVKVTPTDILFEIKPSLSEVSDQRGKVTGIGIAMWRGYQRVIVQRFPLSQYKAI